MKSINRLGKISEVIGKTLFYILIVITVFIVISFNLSNLEENPEISIVIGSILGNILAVVLVYYFWRLLFRPIYNLNKNIQLKSNNQLTEQQFKKKWTISLISSLIFGILFIVGTFGISLLLMIPHYLLMSKSKSL